MIVKVHEHNVEIDKTPVNELEVNITKVKFQFDEVIPTNYVKKAFFTLEDTSIEVLIQNNECNIPSEVLTKKGTVELGVIAYEVQNEELIARYNPSSDYFDTWSGSLKEADNTEPITPTDKEQIEQQLQDISNQMDNIDIEAEKVEHTTTITITKKDGTSYDVQVLDGEKGDKGDKGDAGAIKMLIVAELPQTGQDDTIYLVPLENPDVSGNNYAEYVYINNAWELLGKIGVQVDLTDYVKNTDYATSSQGGVVKTGYGLELNKENKTTASNMSYATYIANGSNIFIGKGTLENVITGKGLTTKSYVDGLVGDINSALDLLNGEVI